MSNYKERIVNAIKALGYNSRQVSVKDNGGSLNWSFSVTVRDPKVNMEAVEQAAKGFQEIDRCQASGEILSGGNVYIRVKATEEVEEQWAKEFLPMLEEAAAKIEDGQKGVRVNDNYSLYHVYGDIYSLYFFASKTGCGVPVGYDRMSLKSAALVMRKHNEKIQQNGK